MITYDQLQQFFYSTLINNGQFFSAFGTKMWGDGRDQETITHFLSRQQIPFNRIITLEQIHSANIQDVSSVSQTRWEKIPECDGVITSEPHIALTVITADCIPIVFTDKKTGLIGISHQGWRGSVKRMAVKMVDNLVSRGAKEEDIVVSIGPSIGDCCYTIEDERYYEFREEFNGYGHKIFFTRAGKIHLNLALLNYLLLVDRGISKVHLDFFPFCTCCDKKRFFSFRRDKPKHAYFPRTFNIVIKLYD